MDVLNLHAEDSIFLQQASHLTHGIYYRVRRKDGLLQYLNVRTPKNRSKRCLILNPGYQTAHLLGVAGYEETTRDAFSRQGRFSGGLFLSSSGGRRRIRV